MNGFEIEKLNVAIEVLQLLQDKIKDGNYDGWGLDLNSVCVTKGFLENIVNGVYSN